MKIKDLLKAMYPQTTYRIHYYAMHSADKSIYYPDLSESPMTCEKNIINIMEDFAHEYRDQYSNIYIVDGITLEAINEDQDAI